MKTALFASGLMTLFAVSARAAGTSTWTGAGADTNWTTAANWSSLPTDGPTTNLAFPSPAPAPSSTNNSQLTTLSSIGVAGDGYQFAGTGLSLSGGLTSTAPITGPTFTMPLTATATQTFSNSGAAVTLGALTVSSPLTFDGGGTFLVNGTVSTGSASGITVKSGTLVVTGSFGVAITVDGGGVFEYDNATVNGATPITLQPGATLRTTGFADWNFPINLSGVAASAPALIQGANSAVFQLDGGLAEEALTGAGPLSTIGQVALNSASSCTGNIRVLAPIGSGKSILLLDTDGALGSGAVQIDDGATLSTTMIGTDLSNALTIGSATTTSKAATLSLNTSPSNVASAITLANDFSSIGGTSVVSALSGIIGGPGSLNVSGGKLSLSTAGAWAHATYLNGTLQLAAGGSLPTATSVSIDQNGVFDLNGHSATIGSLASIAGNSIGLVKLGSGTLSTGGNNTSTSFSGVISGTGGVNFSGSGTKTLIDGPNSYSGPTAVGGGTLLVDGGGLLAAGTVAIAAGATLALGRNARVGAITSVSGTVAPGSTIAPRNGLSGSLSLDTGSTLAIVLDGTGAGQSSNLAVTGSVALGGSTLAVTVSTPPALGDRFIIIANDGTDAVSGAFSGAPEGGVIAASGVSFAISYVGGDGNDVTLTAVAGGTTPPDLAGVDLAGVDLAGVNPPDLGVAPDDLAGQPPRDLSGLDLTGQPAADLSAPSRGGVSQASGCGCEVGARAPVDFQLALVMIAGMMGLVFWKRRLRSRYRRRS